MLEDLGRWYNRSFSRDPPADLVAFLSDFPEGIEQEDVRIYGVADLVLENDRNGVYVDMGLLLVGTKNGSILLLHHQGNSQLLAVRSAGCGLESVGRFASLSEFRSWMDFK